MKKPENRLLVVDDEPAICKLVERVARPLGWEVRALTRPDEFRQTLDDFEPSLLVLDLKMPGADGVQLLQQLHDRRDECNVIVISGMDQRVLNTAEKLGRMQGLRMAGVLQKPLRRSELERHLSNALCSTVSHSRSDLESALSGNEIVVHYQPKISRSGGRWLIDGAEALVRWQHPGKGLLQPGDFLDHMEEHRLIDGLTEYVLREAIRQAATWQDDGSPFRVAVNLSASLVDDLEFPDRVAEVLSEYGLPGHLLTIELTESTAMADAAKAMDIFLRLCVNDIELAIDDFGTGFSSLQQLYQLPFGELKIDRVFIGALPDDEEARAIVRATVEMAHALNIKVCAEGVETRPALEYLESVGCDRAQGYLVSPAVPAAEFEGLARDWNGKE